MTGTKFIDVGTRPFEPWRIRGVTHALSTHALFGIDALTALARRLQERGCVRSHSDAASAATPFNEAPRLHPASRSAPAAVLDLDHAQGWTSLLNVQVDPAYRQLVRAVLDDVEPVVTPRDPGMSWRAGWIFMTSPGAITPFHMDKEHNFILQIAGNKRLYVWDHRDESAVSEGARDLFHAGHDRSRVRWHEDLRARARVFELQPGMGAYMPSTSPHLVENGPGPSITASFTYYTQATRRDAAVHTVHEHLRRLGMSPSAVGRSPHVDSLWYRAFRAAQTAVHMLRRARGAAVITERAEYAAAVIS